MHFVEKYMRCTSNGISREYYNL